MAGRRERRRGRFGARSASALALVSAIAVTASLLAGGAPAAAQESNGYRLEATSVFRVDGDVPTVDVEITYRMTNTTRDRNLGGGRFEYYYYDGVRLPIDAPIADLAVTVDGHSVAFSQAEVEGYPVIDVEFNRDLRYNRTATIVVRYHLTGEPPRTQDSFQRVNPAYVSFPVYSYADDGHGDVRIELPPDWRPDYVGSDFDDVRRENATFVLEALDIPDSDEFGMLFTARRDDRLESTPVSVGASQFEIRAWPGDAAWLSFAETSITDGVPVLEDLVGSPWPESRVTEVIEASTPYLRGYAGFYDGDADVIEVGEDIDSHTMLHELSHAWFNRSTIAQRWLSEGLADDVGARAVAALGEELPAPEDYDVGEPLTGAEPFPLNSWDEPFGLDEATEYHGYRTSFLVVRSLSDEIGEDRMRDLVASVLAGQRAYPPENGVSDGDDRIDWREFLDLAEQVGGTTTLADLYRDHVVTARQADDLDAREEALVRYAALEAHGGSWAPPATVRTAMAGWGFDAANVRIDAAEAALDVRDALATELKVLDLSPAASIELEYQDAKDLFAVTSQLEQHLAAAVRLVAAQDALGAELASVGLVVPTVTQELYDAAPVAVAGETEMLGVKATRVTEAMADLEATLAAHDLEVPALPPDSFVASPDATLSVIADRSAATDEVADALRRRDDAGSIVERIGAVGSSADEHLDTAASRLAAGDNEGAMAAAEAARAALDDWDARGTARLVAAGIGLVLSVLLLLVVRLFRRRPQSRPPSTSPPPPPPPPLPPPAATA